MITLKFNEAIYTLKSVQEATKAYAEFAQFEIKKQKPYIRVAMKNNSSISDTMLKDEFSNFVLSRLKMTED